MHNTEKPMRMLHRLCDSCRIQTCNLLIRSQMLYSIELMSRILWLCGCKVSTFISLDQTFLSKK